MYGHSKPWIAYTYISFGVAAGLVLLGIAYLDLDIWQRAFMAVGTFFLIGSCFNLAKVIRDEHEQARLITKVEDAKTEKLLRDYDLHAAPLTASPRAAA